MKNGIRFFFTSLFIILSRAYDAYSTFGYTPDLENEANPLVSWLGLGWTPLLIVITILMVYSIVVYYLATFRPVDFFPKETGFNFEEFSTFIYLGKKDKWLSYFYKIPDSLGRFNNYMGIFMTRCLVFAGIVSTIMWLLIKYTESYLEHFHSARLIYVILIVGGILVMWAGHRQLFRQYQNQQMNS
ncbi:MAG: hypothetical protein HKN16_03280 [Saprospiraceae bacterium]|nr:hypothetical protein [Saprospiraceae bacterium]